MSRESIDARRIALTDLVRVRTSIEAAKAALRPFDWDSEVELVHCTRRDAVHALDLALRGELTPVQLEDWADAIEVRDDVSFEGGTDGLVHQCIAELANPTLYGELTAAAIQRWRSALTADDA